MSVETVSQLQELISQEEFSAEFFQSLKSTVFQEGDRRPDLRAILADWEEFSARYSNRTNARVIEGFCHWMLEQIDEAKEALRGAHRIEWGHILLSGVHADAGEIDEAVRVAEEGYEKYPDSVELGLCLCRAHANAGQVEEASKLLKKLRRKAESRPEYHLLSGLIAQKEGEYEQAIEHFRQAAEVDARFVPAHFHLGYLLGIHGHEEDAIAAYEKCVEIEPVCVNALINLGILYEDCERYADAVGCFESVLSFHPTHARARRYLEDASASTLMFIDREQEQKKSRQNQIMQIPVSDFELSVRSRNCLAKMNITTLGDLVMKSESELLTYKNFGETSLEEIKELLRSKGLRLGQGLESEGGGSSDLDELDDPEKQELLDKPVEELNLSVRSQRCVERLGIETVRDLCLKTEIDLMGAKNFGMTSLNEIKRRLAELGLRLRP